MPKTGNKTKGFVRRMFAEGGDVPKDEVLEEIKKTEWYKEFTEEYGEPPDLETSDYDYRKAWKAGVRPERDPYDKNKYHWASSDPSTGEMLKSEDHPTAWKELYMRETGKNPDEVGVTKEQYDQLKEKKMAKGGVVKNEMNKLFAEGGVMQEGGTVDPVSGNDVPPGAMQEEVRDDIPAQLSEGEFVMPADVVRYWGLEKLMAMRDKAKMGLKKMEEIGQMGNAEEVPDGEALHGGEEEMDDESFSSEIDSILGEEGGDEERGYAAGGYVVPENEATYRDAPIKGFEMVPMINDAGQTIYIPYINGVAQLSVPAGYKVKTSGVTTPTTATPAVGGAGGAGSGDYSGGGDSGGPGGGGGGGGNTDGSTPGGGQGISNTAISLGLQGLAISQSPIGKGISAVLGLPVSSLVGLGSAMALDAQIDAIGKSMDAMSAAQNSNISGQVATVSDASGNVSTVSNQSITDAFDAATFGITSQGLSAEAAATAQGLAAADAVGMEGMGVAGNAGVATGGTTAADGVGMDGMGVGTGVGVGGTGVGVGESGVSATGESSAGGPGSGGGGDNGGDSSGSSSGTGAGDSGAGSGSAGDGAGGAGAGTGLAKGGFVSKLIKPAKQKGLAGRRK